MRVLIVEDEEASREVLQEFLSPYGECDAVENGAEAVRRFRRGLEDNKPYDLVCMDIMMPIMDGQQAVKEIRKIEKDKGIASLKKVKVIMVTALKDSDNMLEAFYNGGVDSYIVKPIELEALLGEIRNLNLIEH